MNFKRIVAFMMILVMALSVFAACESDKAPEVSTEPDNTSAPEISGNETVLAPDETTSEITEEVTNAPEETTGEKVEYPTITIAEALALCEQFVETASTERYYIRGIVKEIQSETYGQMIIEDSTGSILVYGTYSADGSIRYDAMTSKPVLGDEVLLYGTLQNYKGNTKEIQNGRLIEFVANGYVPETPKLPEFGTTLTIAELLALPLSSNQVTEGRYYVEATVDSVTNANFGAMIIKDSTGSISVYNSQNADGSVTVPEVLRKWFGADEIR